MQRHLLPISALGAFIAALGATGCGHPATVQECEEILENVARLELEDSLGKGNARAIAKEIDATKRALKENVLKDCVGKRITNAALDCVRNATSAEEAVKDCFD